MALKTKTPKLSLADSDFVAPPDPKRIFLLEINGREKSGKTTMALNSPGPIAYFDIDRRGLYAVSRARTAGKEILYVDLPLPRNLHGKDAPDVMKEHAAIWEKFIHNYQIALDASMTGEIRTIVIDTATDLWEIKVLSHFGRTDKVMPRDRGIPNSDFREMVRRARNYHANVIFIEKAKEKWENNEPSGKFERKGQPDLGFDVDCTTQTKIVTQKGKQQKYALEVQLNGINGNLNGVTMTEEDWDSFGPFVWLASQTFEDSAPDDWE